MLDFLNPIKKYLYIGVGIIFLVMLLFLGIDYARIKGLESEVEKLTLEVANYKELNSGLQRDKTLVTEDYKACSEALTTCNNLRSDMQSWAEEYRSQLNELCSGANKRLKDAWEACEAKLRDMRPEGCDDLILRSIQPFYFQEQRK